MTALVGIIMGSTSDWETMSFAAEKLELLGIPFEVEVVSAHRTPDKLFSYALAPEGLNWLKQLLFVLGETHLMGLYIHYVCWQ
jgi:5-(carboxyamino)imidazole ribonucleotide mutase